MHIIVILFSVLIGTLYAFFLYSIPNQWSGKLNKLLFVLRTVTVASILWFLLAPDIKINKKVKENAIVALAIDNSSSLKKIAQESKLIENIKMLSEDLKNKQIDIKIYDLTSEIKIEKIDSLKFNFPKTNLFNLISTIENDHIEQNLKSIILISDGIINDGQSPVYQDFNSQIYTIGLGDTLLRKDLSISQVNFNKLVNKNSKFPIKVTLKKTGFGAVKSILTIKKVDLIIEKKEISFGLTEKQKDITIISESNEEPFLSYKIDFEPVMGEITKINNTKNIYIETAQSEKNILIFALSPHPDLKVLKDALSQNKEYKVETYIQGIGEIQNKQPDLVIYHQIPSSDFNANHYILNFKKLNTPFWFIIGNQSNIAQTNAILDGFKIMTNGQTDKVQVEFSKDFDKFLIPQNLTARLVDFPPVIVPFGEYNHPIWDVVLYQKVGSFVTNKPLWAINTQNKNQSTAITIADGIWQWSMIEKATYDNDELTQSLILKTTQLLLATKDKKKFRFAPINQNFDISDKIAFESESKNEVDEWITGNEIDILLTHKNGKKYNFNCINSNNGIVFETAGLPEGIYNFKATSIINKKEEISNGTFSISNIDIENTNYLADFNLLKNIAQKNNGLFYHYSNLKNITNEKFFENTQNKVYIEESFSPTIQLKWIMFAIILLLFTEWAARKYLGSI